MVGQIKGILLGGTSHVGKSTLAAHLSRKLDWPAQSTDKLARHPGRPWPILRPQVAEFYTRLSPETIDWLLQVHYDNLRPRLDQIIDSLIVAGAGFIIEGSALRPDHVHHLHDAGVATACLHASRTFLRERMRRESEYVEREPSLQRICDTFIERSLRDNEAIVASANASGVPLVDVEDAGAVEALIREWTVPADKPPRQRHSPDTRPD